MSKGNRKIVISATDRLQKLWEKGLFKITRQLPEISEHLAEEGYNFTTAELGMALKRASYLTRRGKKGKYTYIQKGPYQKYED